MFKLFRQIFKQEPAAEVVAAEPPTPPEAAPDPDEARQALERFIVLVTAHLDAEESRRLTRRVLSAMRPGQTTEDAIQDGILDDGQRMGQWLLLQVDWKATEEVAWQANELLKAAGIADTWTLLDEEQTSVPQALLAFASWVQRHGMRLLHLDLGHDAYYAFLLREDKVDAALQAGREAGLTLQDSDAFAAREN